MWRAIAEPCLTEHLGFRDTQMMSELEPHSMIAESTHDERERQHFVTQLRGHLASRVVPGNYAVYERRVEPRFLKRHGRQPQHFNEVRAEMEKDDYYQFWSAMQRCSQELMWESVIDPVERAASTLSQKANSHSRTSRGSLRLNSKLVVPRYHTAVDIHLQPGGYHSEFSTDDVSAGVIYDMALNIYSNGGMGPRNEYLGELLVDFFRERYPAQQPANILDMGCAIGNSTLPWARAFADARVEAIDVAAPQLRYAHARADAWGIPVHFSQQNAECTDFEDACFDLIVSHIMLHETSKSALNNILRECHRLLRPGGLMLHLEIPRGRTVLEQFLYNWESWNNNETFGQFMTEAKLEQLASRAGFAETRVACVDYTVRRERQQQLYSSDTYWKILLAQK